MVLIATDLSVDIYDASGASNRFASPQAVYLSLPPDKLLGRRYSLYQGSGGTTSSLLIVTPSGTNTQVHATVKNKLASIVDEICSAFGLTKEELAKVFKIQSRKTLYNWINDETKPRKTTMARIYNLLMISKAWATSGFGADREQLFRPIIDGQSIFDLLNKPDIDQELVLFAGSRLNIMSQEKAVISDPFA